MDDPLLAVAPAEVGLLLQRRSHPRLVGAALLGLAGRGLLRVECTSPNRFQVEPSWHLEVVDDGGGSPSLRSHEEQLLEVVQRLVSRRTGARREVRDLDDVDELRGSAGSTRVERALRRDAAERGWLTAPPRRRPTASARALRPLALETRERLLAGGAPWTSPLLALATALDALPPERAGAPRSGTPAADEDGPAWFVPGRRPQDRGWPGALQLARAVAAPHASGGLDWGSVPELVGSLLDLWR
ncbi:hypothetical protein ACUN7V_16045 [Quadrisphaera oryzae]|uniref:hypothetical protein n=1 Tax=Quadrisphaera TaxID=317661 RepID=UPI0016465703|nr:hypothetical protein [Quadrisphaera sp. RL12-1S]MBC3763538.1 hypothetical protein [Quadrisphaera sp. RL12-1S]